MEEQVTTQDTEMATEESRIETAVEETPRRRRRGRKRTKFQVPKRFPLPVRALWQLASEEERKRAHETCTAILEHWLGKASKKEVARTLSLPPLRVWQLSQQALSGMLAGLLVQPRVRGRLSAMPKAGRAGERSEGAAQEDPAARGGAAGGAGADRSSQALPREPGPGAAGCGRQEEEEEEEHLGARGREAKWQDGSIARSVRRWLGGS